MRLVRGSLQGRATKKGRGLYIAAGACRVFVAQGTFRLRRVGGLLHVDSLSARMTIDGQALFPGFGRVVGVARFSLESLLPAPLELRPTSYDGHTMPTLSWNAVEGATTYRVRVARDADFIEIVKQAKTTATHTRALRLRAGNYFWQVVAERLGRWGHPSKIYSLRIRSKPQRL